MFVKNGDNLKGGYALGKMYKFNKLLIRYKKAHASMINYLDNEEARWRWKKVHRMCSELIIVNAGFKCEACGIEDKLTIHHMITRFNRHFMPKERYIMQRMYWANKILLCTNCHSKIHEGKVEEDELHGIRSDYIQRLKEKWKN